ncbi:uncharacterized protein LOC119579100 [Penaeus monodon]|uniref:uncharacterized protein LOC119579100 n=1 Tax=Penaeus monodon TaxID=6687 RepID=UPI0018A78C77|nr:uncharacterized protein LOC119579100 [Penaeus monodon]
MAWQGGVSWSLESLLSRCLYALAPVLAALLLSQIYRRQQKIWLIEQLPGPKGLPLLGNLLHMWVDHEELFRRLCKICELGNVARFWVGSKPYCIVSSARAVETILSSSKHIDKSWDYTLFRPWLGEGLVTSTGVKWHTRRKMLTPAFHFKILEDFVDVFTAQAETLVEKLKTKADGRPFDIYNDITLCALDIICETAMGRSINAQRNSGSEIVKAIHNPFARMGTLIQFRQFRPWLHSDFAFRLSSYGREQEKCLRVIHGLATDTIELRRKARQEEKRRRREEEGRREDDARAKALPSSHPPYTCNRRCCYYYQVETPRKCISPFLLFPSSSLPLQPKGIPGQKTRQAFLDLLLEYSEKDPTITDEDIRDEVNTFMFAGHDTTSAAMNWFLYAMGSHPDAQECVFEEIEAVMQGSDGAPSAADLREMKYLELCLKETLRLFPPIPMIIRELKEDAVISNYSIPAGTSIVIHVFRLHHDPEQFPDPEVFDPKRFLPQNSIRRHSYAYVPFSAGPRNCIGQKFSFLEMKAILCSILRKFRVESVVPRKDLKLLAELILLPKGGNLVRLFPRVEGDDGRCGDNNPRSHGESAVFGFSATLGGSQAVSGLDAEGAPHLEARVRASQTTMEEGRSWLGIGSPGLPTYILLTTCLAVVMTWLYKRQQKVWLVEQMPGPKALPLVGNSLFFWGSPEVLFQQLYKVTEFGDVARFWLGPKPYCMLSSARAVESILSSQKHLHKSWDYSLLHPWLGEGLITSAGRKWHSRRKLLTPAFHFRILEDFLDIFTSQTDTLVRRLRARADGRAFDVFHYITLCALDIICETAMGRRVNAQEDSESAFVRAIHDLSSLIQFRQFRPWLHPDFVFHLTSHGRKHDACLKVIHDLAKQTISMRRKARRAKGLGAQKKAQVDEIGQKTRQAFLDLLLEYSEKDPTITNEDILEEVNTFMFAGHDTTTAAMNWFLYVMGTHREIQTRVQEELDEVFQGSDRPPTMADLRELKYLELCMKESLRVFPSVPAIIREIKEEIQINNYRIPAGTSIAIHVYRIHRDPEQFPNPEVFDPDRFLPENCNKRHPYAYIPFSAGPRNCIGQKFAQLEMKVVLSSILRNFRVESDIPWKDMKVLGELILRPKEGNPLKLLPRK